MLAKNITVVSRAGLVNCASDLLSSSHDAPRAMEVHGPSGSIMYVCRKITYRGTFCDSFVHGLA